MLLASECNSLTLCLGFVVGMMKGAMAWIRRQLQLSHRLVERRMSWDFSSSAERGCLLQLSVV